MYIQKQTIALLQQFCFSLFCLLPAITASAADNPNAQTYQDIRNAVTSTNAGETGNVTITADTPVVFPSYIAVGNGKTINISGGPGGAVLDGEGSSALFSISATDNSHLNFTDVSFQNANRDGHGGAFATLSGALTFNGETNFTDNTAASTRGESVGGAIRADNTDIAFNGSATFTGNSSVALADGTGRGGAIYTANNGDLTFGRAGQGDTLTATGNRAGSGGGFLYAAGTDKTVDFNALSVFGGPTDAEGNTAQANGGAIQAANGVTLNFHQNASFQHNTAQQNGGALAMSNSVVNFNGTNTQFLNNSAVANGGAIRVYGNNSQLTFGLPGENSTVTASGNHSDGSGGFLFQGDPGNTVFNSEAVFGGTAAAQGNSAAGSGGAIYLSNGTLTFNNNAAFQHNTAAQAGGAMYIGGNTTVNFYGEQTSFLNNSNGSAQHGGAIRFASSGSSLTTFGRAGENDRLTVSGNKADGAGGFFHNNNTGNTLVFNAQSTFGGDTADEGNQSATSMGGVFYTSAGETAFNNDAAFKNNSAFSSGGAIYISGTANVNFYGNATEFTSNRAGLGSSAHGGGISANGTGAMILGNDNAGSTFTANYNKASGSGGFLYNAGRDILFKSASAFTGNESASTSGNLGGGAIFQNSGNTVFNNTASFTDNKATSLGGAIFVRSGDVIFNNGSSFSGNTDSSGANDIYLQGGRLITTGTQANTFSGGISSAQAGAVFNAGSGLFTAEMSKFLGTYTQTNASGNALINGETSQQSTFHIQGGDAEFAASFNGTLNNAANVSFTGDGKTLGGTVNNIQTGQVTVSADNAVLDGQVNNDGTLVLSGMNTSLEGRVQGAGTTEVTGTAENNGALAQQNLTVHTGGSLTTNADSLLVANAIDNSGDLHFTAGINRNAVNNNGSVLFDAGANEGVIRGTGTLRVNGPVENRAAIEQKGLVVLAEGALTTDGDYLSVGTDGITLDGALNVTRGSFTTTGTLTVNERGLLNLHNPTPQFSSPAVTVNAASIETKSGSKMNLEVFADGRNDFVQTASDAKLDGKLNVRAGVGVYNDEKFTLVEGGSLSGALVEDIQNGNPLSLASLDDSGRRGALYASYKFEIDGNTINLLMRGYGISTLSYIQALTFNQREAARALDSLSGTASGDLADVINTLADLNLSDQEAKAALSEISPYFLANILRPRTDPNFRTGLYNRLYNHCPSCSNNGLWAEGDYGQATWSGDDNSVGDFKVNSGGFKFGAQRYFAQSDLIIGLYGAYTPQSLSQNASKADLDSVGGGVYGGWIQENWEVKGLLGATYDSYDVKRKISAPSANLNRTAKSDFNGYSLRADLEAAYKIPLDEKMWFKPYLGIESAMTDYQSFTETNADALNVRVNGDRLFSSTARAGLGVQSKRNRLGWNARAEYNYLITDPYPEIDVMLAGTDTRFKSRGAETGRSGLGLNAGIDYDLTPRLNIYLNGEFRLASDYENLHGSLGLRYAFCGGCKARNEAPAPVSVPDPADEMPLIYKPMPVAEPAPTPKAESAPVAAPRKVGTARYGFDQADLTPSARKKLSQAAEEIKKNPNAKITAVGHTDSVGTLQYNQRLSERRARNAAHYLRQQGVEAPITVKGMSKTQPEASNATREGRAQNRRVEIYLH